MISVLELLDHLTDPFYIVNWGSVLILSFIIFAECSFIIGFFLPGNSMIFVAGFLCAARPEILHTNLIILIAAMSFGAWMGYYIGYWWGKKKLGPAWLKENTRVFFFKKKYVDGTIQFYDDHGGKILIIGRFLPLVRTFAPIIGGMIQMHYGRYMLYNFIGGLFWVSSLACTGYYLGGYKWVQDKYGAVIILLIIIAIASILLKTIAAEKRSR